MDMQRIKRVGTAAVCNGGKVLQEHFGKLRSVRKKVPSIWLLKQTSDPKGSSSTPSPRFFPIMLFLPKRAGHRQVVAVAGSSIRWMALPILPTTYPFFVFRLHLRWTMTF